MYYSFDAYLRVLKVISANGLNVEIKGEVKPVCNILSLISCACSFIETKCKRLKLLRFDKTCIVS